MIHICKDKYRLELHWKSIKYNDDSTANLIGAYFSGPALKNAQKINSNDTIDVDLTPQHIIVFNSYYIVRLTWQSVDYKSDELVNLGSALLKNNDLKELHKLEDNDYIIIDTEKHEEKTHAYHLVYDAQVVRYDDKPHSYTK